MGKEGMFQWLRLSTNSAAGDLRLDHIMLMHKYVLTSRNSEESIKNK